MATITIASMIIPNVNYTGSVFTWRIFSDKSWVAQDGTIVPARGDADTFYKEYTVSVSGTNGTVPQITLLSQTDAPNEKNARYSIYWCVDGVLKDIVLANTLGAFQVPDTPSSTTWSALEQYNFGTNRRYYKDDGTYSALIIDQKIAAVTGTTNLATSTRAGLPAAGTIGRQRLLSNSDEGLVIDTGSTWWSVSEEVFDVKRFGAIGDGVVDDTTTIQSAFTATGGRGHVHFPRGSYLISDSITCPQLAAGTPPQSFSAITVRGDGPFSSCLINKASANKPTLLISRDLVSVRGLGFFGDENFPNDGIKISQAGRIYIDHNKFFVKGNAIFLEKAQSVFIQSNFGGISGGQDLVPAGVTTKIASFAATNAFIYVNQPVGGFVNQFVFRDNMNENYSYQVYCEGTDAGAGYFSWVINGNQSEGSTAGFKLKYVRDSEISGNYTGEGGTGFTFDLDTCRGLRVGPNYVHFANADSKISAIKMNDVSSATIEGSVNRLYLTGTTIGDSMIGGFLSRLQDESSDHRLTLVNVGLNDFTLPEATMNSQTGHAVWRSDSTNVTLYPGVRLGDEIKKLTPTAATSPGWVATVAASTGAMVQTVGTGPFPIIIGNPTNAAALGDYCDPVAYDFKIIMLSGGATGTATYKVQWKTAGGGAYADLTNTTTTTELAHLVGRETGGGPVVAFQLRWPIGTPFVNGDTWTLTAVAAPVWKATGALAA